jgi:Uma2 family endonuclease
MHMHGLREWTAEDLLDMPDDGQRYEVIDGELFVTPSPSRDHQRALSVLFRLIADYLDRERVGEAFFSPSDITFSRRRSVQPDLFVAPFVDGRTPREFRDMKHLLLAAEVLSPSTARLDRVKKRILYREEGVDEFCIVDLDARTFERSTPADSRVEVLDLALTWLPNGAATPFELDIPDYFTRVLDR